MSPSLIWASIRRRLKALAHGPLAPVIRRVLKTLLLEYYVVYGDSSRLSIAETAKCNNTLFNTVSGTIEVQDHAFFGFNVCVLTGTHDYTLLNPGRQDAILTAVNDIVIEEGVWIATNATIIGPARIGAWSVVASGALVRGDVPPHTIVAGVPAKVIRSLDESPNVQDLAQTSSAADQSLA